MFESIGSAISTGLDVLLNRPGSGPSALPKKSILSSNVTLSFIDVENSKEFYVAEFEELQKNKLFKEKKRFKPFGSMKSILLKEDAGWELTLTGEKTDGTLDRFIYIQEMYLRGKGVSSLPNIESTFNNEQIIASNLSFKVYEKARDNNKNLAVYVYGDVSIISYSENIPKDNEPVTYTLSLFAPYRSLTPYSVNDPDKELETVLSKMIASIVANNKN